MPVADPVGLIMTKYMQHQNTANRAPLAAPIYPLDLNKRLAQLSLTPWIGFCDRRIRADYKHT